jgi:Predicted integral membrane protein (DUF2269)
MDTYRTVLYLHVLSLLLGIGAATVVGVCLFRLRSAQTLADALPWGMLAGKTERVFPVAILGLFSTGAYMTSDVWTWSTRWIVVSIVALALVALQGPLVAGLRAKALERALGENGPGPLGDSVRRLARDPVLWVVTFANPGIVLGILWNMINKPSTAEAIAAVVVGYAAGAAVALPFTRRQAIDARAVTDPTA